MKLEPTLAPLPKMEWCQKWRPVILILSIYFSYAVVTLLYKKVLNVGTSHLVIVTYRQTASAIFLTPIACFGERKQETKLTTGVLCYLFFSALLGATLSQYLYLVGLQHASVAFAAAFINLAPASTFLMALAFRLETLKLKSKGGKAKMLGSLVCIGGVILLALYRGIPTNKLAHLHESLNGAKDVNLKASGKSPESYAVGSILLTSSVMLWCSWFLLQAKIGKRYPYKYSSTAIMSSFSAIQSAILCFAINRDISIWVLKGKLQIISVLFAVSTLLGMIVSIRTGAQVSDIESLWIISVV